MIEAQTLLLVGVQSSDPNVAILNYLNFFHTYIMLSRVWIYRAAAKH